MIKESRKKENRNLLAKRSLECLTTLLVLGAAHFASGSRAFAQTPSVVWAGLISDGPASTNAYSDGRMAIDSSGNVFFVDWFNLPTCSVNGQLLTNTSTSPGGFANAFDAFVAKRSNAGDPLWVRQIGGNGNEIVRAVATDANGNIIVSLGSTSTNIKIDPISLTGTGTENLLLVKYSSQGNLLWARQVKSDSFVLGTGLAADPAGNIFAIGSYFGTNANFGISTLTKTNSLPADFLAKYDPLGNLIWVKQFNINDSNAPVVAVDAQGNALTFEVFTGVADFGTVQLTNTNYLTMSIAKVDPRGTVLWANEAANTSGYPQATAVAVDTQGNCRVLGSYMYGDLMVQSTNLPGSGTYGDNFVANFDSSGNLSWANRISGSLEVIAENVVLDAAGNCYATGRSDGLTATFGSLTLTNAGPNYSHAYAAKYDTNGNLLWAKLLNSPGVQTSGGGVVDSHGNVFVCGYASGPTLLDLDGLTVQSPTNAGPYYYIAKISGPALSIQPAGGNVLISWPTNAAGLNLESATALSGPWSPVTNSLVANGEQFVVTNTVAGGSRYYRLRNF